RPCRSRSSGRRSRWSPRGGGTQPSVAPFALTKPCRGRPIVDRAAPFVKWKPPMEEIRIIPVRGIGEVRPGDDLAGLILAALAGAGQALVDGDVLVVTQKIVSKAEGRLVDPATVEPSAFARQIAAQGRKDAH